MIGFTVNYSALSCHWVFKETFIALPQPGDGRFSTLYKSLLPFGVTLTSISIEKYIQSLAEERLVISLLNGRLRLRLAYAGFDFVLTGVEEGEESKVAELFQVLCPVLQQFGADVEQGQVRFIYEAFVHLNEMANDDFFRQHLPGYNLPSQLLPDSFAYKVTLRDGPGSPQIRISIARSVAPGFPSDLFVNMAMDYVEPGEVGQFVKQATDDWYEAMAYLNLKLHNLEGNENART